VLRNRLAAETARDEYCKSTASYPRPRSPTNGLLCRSTEPCTRDAGSSAASSAQAVRRLCSDPQNGLAIQTPLHRREYDEKNQLTHSDATFARTRPARDYAVRRRNIISARECMATDFRCFRRVRVTTPEEQRCGIATSRDSQRPATDERFWFRVRGNEATPTSQPDRRPGASISLDPRQNKWSLSVPWRGPRNQTIWEIQPESVLSRYAMPGTCVEKPLE